MTASERLWQAECVRHGAEPAAAERDLVICEKGEIALKRHLNVIVPVAFACVGERIVASSYQSVRSVLDAHLEKYRSVDALLSAEAFSALDGALRPYLGEWGYRGAAFPARYGISLVQDDADAVPESVILDGTVKITDEMCGMENLTSMNLTDCAGRGAYAQIADGKIVCIASVNCVSELGQCVEIGVECAPEYRLRGYAVSCVSALTRELCAGGNVVLYRHYHTNIGSSAVAKKAGFRAVGRFFSYTSFAI